MVNAALAACIYAAATLYSLPPTIIQTVLDVEGGKLGECSSNTNGSKDCGPMQINSIWIPQLAKSYGLTHDVIEWHLTNDACFNIGVGSWILANNMHRSGDFWTGVGHYHSRTEQFKQRYLDRAIRAALRRYGPDVFQGANAPGASSQSASNNASVAQGD